VTEYLILSEAFKREICKGCDPVAVATVLRTRGHLEHAPGRLQKKGRLPVHDNVWYYHIKPSIFSDEW